MGWAAQIELDAAEKQQREGEEKIERAKAPGMPPLAAAELLTVGKQLAAGGRTRAVKARARLNYALDQMDESERQELDALRAAARAETHGQLAEDPLFSTAPPSDRGPGSPCEGGGEGA